MPSPYKSLNTEQSARPVVERIGIIDLDRGTVLFAQYNPKELQINKTAEWSETANSKGNNPELTFSSTKARQVSLELLFDTYESGADVHDTFIKHLVLLLDVLDPNGLEDQRRPPRIQLEWGGQMPKFIGVVASVSTKYTMFLPTGRPVRATCTCTFTEASKFSFTKK